MAWIWCHHLPLQGKLKSRTGKLAWGVKAKHCWALSTNILPKKFVDSTQQCFAEKNKNKKFKCSRLLEGDEIESRLPFKIFSTLHIYNGHVKRTFFENFPNNWPIWTNKLWGICNFCYVTNSLFSSFTIRHFSECLSKETFLFQWQSIILWKCEIKFMKSSCRY